MKSSDRNLEMDRPISRRYLLPGVGASAASVFVSGQAIADEMPRPLTTHDNAIPDHSLPTDDEYLNGISYRKFLSSDFSFSGWQCLGGSHACA